MSKYVTPQLAPWEYRCARPVPAGPDSGPPFGCETGDRGSTPGLQLWASPEGCPTDPAYQRRGNEGGEATREPSPSLHQVAVLLVGRPLGKLAPLLLAPYQSGARTASSCVDQVFDVWHTVDAYPVDLRASNAERDRKTIAGRR